MVSNHLKFVIPGGVCAATAGMCLMFGFLFLFVSKITSSTPYFIMTMIYTLIPVGFVFLVVGIILLAKGIHEYHLGKTW